jgi:hypothetical protein
MTAFDKAWDLVKAPIYETGIPGIRFVTQGEDEPRWTDMDNVFGFVPSEPSEKDIECLNYLLEVMDISPYL